MMDTAIARIEASRARLRLVMLPPPPAPTAAGPAGSWTARLLSLPMVGAVVESVQAWWTQHPARPVAEMASGAAEAAVKPVAARHPYALVLAAALFGALMAWARPWQWIFRSALFAGLVPQIASRAVSNMPVDSWLTMLGSMLQRRPPSATPAPVEDPGYVPAAAPV